jgi:hypothetical protein
MAAGRRLPFPVAGRSSFVAGALPAALVAFFRRANDALGKISHRIEKARVRCP